MMTVTQGHLVKPGDLSAHFLLEMLQSEYVGMYGFPDPNPEGGLEHAVAPNGGILVLTDDNGPVAVGGWTHHEPGVACLRRMYVHYAHRGKGHSRALLRVIEDHARECGMNRMILETGDVQVRAISLYRSVGYSATEPFGFYKNEIDSVFLGRDL